MFTADCRGARKANTPTVGGKESIMKMKTIYIGEMMAKALDLLSLSRRDLRRAGFEIIESMPCKQVKNQWRDGRVLHCTYAGTLGL
jgi:hypothetical protein